MKTIAKIVSLAALTLTVVPAFLVFAGTLSWDRHAWLMLVGTVLWFVSAPLWMRQSND
jgi:hypothetical protein